MGEWGGGEARGVGGGGGYGKIQWNIISGVVGINGVFCFFWSQWRKCIKNCLCTNKIVINGKGKKC